MGEAIVRPICGRSHGSSPVALRAVGRPVANVPDLIDGEAFLVEDPLPALDVLPAAEGTANVLSSIFLLQYIDDDVALGAEGGHWLYWDGISRLN